MNKIPTLDALNHSDSQILRASKHLTQYEISKLINDVKKNQMLDGQSRGPYVFQEDDGETD